MAIKNLALAAALGLSMASAPVMAQTATVERTGAVLQQANGQDSPPYGRGRGRGPVDGDEGIFAGTTTYIIAIIVIIVIAIGIYFAIDDDEDDRATP